MLPYDMQDIYLMALRYALGCNTATPGILIQEVKKVLDEIDNFHLYQMESAISFALQHELIGKNWKTEWLTLVDAVENKAKEKEKE